MSREATFIDSLRALATHPAARNLEDDCAVLELGSETLVLTHDMLVEGTHYLPGADMADVAWKLVATNLSDLAAKGAQPLGVLLGHMLGDGDERFLTGLAEVLAHYQVPLLGGDTTSGTGTRSHGLTAIGRATHTPVPSRSGAQPGDGLWVCGNIGDAFRGYQELTQADWLEEMGLDRSSAKAPDPRFASKFLRPRPLLAQGIALAPVVTAMMDVSDGLLLDAWRMGQASGVTLALSLDDVPFSPEFKALASQGSHMDVMSNGWLSRDAAVRWGDDYALLFTLPNGTEPPVHATRIGNVERRGPAHLVYDGKPQLDPAGLGYQHK